MALNNIFFLLMFAVLLAGYWLISALCFKSQCKKKVLVSYLLLWSYLLIAVSDIRFLICVIAITLVTWFIPIACEKKLLDMEKAWMLSGVIVNLVFLGVFKYFNFFYGEISALLGQESVTLKIILPIGISFYTFSSISYIVDVYKK